MESSKEKIEAQLCAYVDGELDDAQRAEIEQHLAANPQHQALIAELRAASGLLRDLPRVAAPIELNESLCGQLERSSLLNPVDDHSDPLRSSNRWPQFTAVAAVLILAVGLGLVIYFVLPPSGGRSGNQLAIDNRSKEPGLAATTRDSDGDARLEEKSKSTTDGTAANSDLDRYKKMSESEMSSRAGAKAADAADHNAAGGKDAFAYSEQSGRSVNRDLDVARQTDALKRGMVSAAEVENVRKWMNESLGTETNFFNSTGNNSLYLFVSTQNTSAANGQLAAYFKGNGIQYMAGDSRPVADVVADAGQKHYAAFGGGAGGFGGAGGGVGGGGASPAIRAANGSRLGGREMVRAQPSESLANAPAPSAKPDFSVADSERGLKNAPAPSGATELNDAIKQEASASATPPAPQSPSTQLARGDNASLKKLNVMEEQLRARRPTVEAKDKAAAGTTFELRDADRPIAAAKLGDERAVVQNNVIIARMNRRQLNELSAELSREQGQRAELKEFAPSPVDGLADSAKVKGVIASLGAPAQTSTDLGATVVDPTALTLGKSVAPVTPAPAKPSAASASGGAGIESFGATSRPAQRAYDRAGAPASGPAASDWAARVEGLNPIEDKKSGLGDAAAAGGDALHLKIDPMDEPVDVVIVVKSDAATADTAAVDAQKPAAKPAPAGTPETSTPADGKK